MVSERFFVWTVLSLSALSVVCKLLLLVIAQYPRQSKWTRTEDALSIVFGLMWIGLAIWTLVTH